jgi:hypothetical protein
MIAETPQIDEPIASRQVSLGLSLKTRPTEYPGHDQSPAA